MDELGYFFPISDWRIPCIESLVESPCDKLPLTYFDSMSGAECQWIMRHPAAAIDKYGADATSIISICSFGG